jgi:hypothetical protein
VKGATYLRYEAAVDLFLRWLIHRSPKPPDLDQLDRWLSAYINETFDKDPSRGCRQKCVLMKCGLVLRYPRLHGRFQMSTKDLDGWATRVPHTPRIPIPRGILLLFASFALNDLRFDVATYLLLAFHGYLRNSDVDPLRVVDVSLPTAVTPGVLRLTQPKKGVAQSVTLTCPIVAVFLREHLKQREGQPTIRPGKVFGITSTTVADALKEYSGEIGFSPHFTPHSLRYGGATNDFLIAVPTTEIKVRGRWAQLKTCEAYVQAGRGLLLAQQLPFCWRSEVDKLLEEPSRLFRLLPK